MMSNLLLDTHMFVWLLAGNENISAKAIQAVEECTKAEGQILISVISIWEIGMLSQKGRLIFKEPVLQWIQEALKAPYVKLATISPEIAIESCVLPGEFHGDPADRMIVATSRVLNTPLLTKDERIRRYAVNGYLECIDI